MAGTQNLIFFLFFLSTTTTYAALLNLDHYDHHIIKKPVKSVNVVFHHQELVETKKRELVSFSRTLNNMDYVGWRRSRRRRWLSEPGSWPPRCIFKCGQCTPCKPVHVPVPPGMSVTTEYYPVAWRCKCGNKLYMP